MTLRDEQIADMVKRVGEALAEAFKLGAETADGGPPLGFCLWIFDFYEEPFCAFVSNEITNARRPELIRIMRAHLKKLEADEAAEGRTAH